ncbi:hypothetical protein [Streptomyces sp. NPDC053048]|uniref:hypothetical protein n=1 Tax=Streptomyces sp. NPDC053048 TaxID=3365694 RepID=UPI0037CE8C79
MFTLQAEAKRLELERDAERAGRREMRALLAVAEEDVRNLDDQVRRLKGQVQRLDGLLRTTQQEQGAEAARLASRRDRLARGCARYRLDLMDARRPRPVPPGGRTVHDLTRHCAALERRLHEFQVEHDAECRLRVDEAGTLAKLPGREPGVAS